MLTEQTIRKTLKFVLKKVDLPSLKSKEQGKVRDIYRVGQRRILITTDRISAFDRVLGYIPFKGQVLNELSAFWFDKTRDIVTNHALAFPDSNVTVAIEAQAYPVEMVVRGYLSGVTSTSIWKAYENGERIIYGIKFPDGMKKNQKLPHPIITPTTKAEHGQHDRKLTEKEILAKKIIKAKDWKQMKQAALALFERGSKICSRAGIILVDTKYEFADYKGKLMLIDEIHTPDSSRFWKKETYLKRLKEGQEPENFDKEFLRLWYAHKGYIGDGEPPKMTEDLIVKTARRYIAIFEMITGKKFIARKYPVLEEINKNMEKYFRLPYK
ncbi:phosphoribosylaminoimidazolesuccinocarboxamide synthase [Candidatus Gottesmanbacteria bacterium RIFCSPLOWO2_02_FULL_42_29]|uniref:Phosphoribosylaminoimidazole-succinocarboxamide synthase n=2 Tax=Candidatus Gottesmaniibacteriota TaxID=1752720 RepID=A0A1F6BK91_9BACT|nr:MAG: Phosphoribosylaminoimidazole-succinocarboxamide synthase [Candidatus Gottesmanbacteria bacterium GW2011_GWA2_42_18]KKS76100.1 MAG: Phosphoribosylaminoimidazole-succinocarboxamide synthase [Candidatus Gottesmanbacteria bacterium GW2011_GWC2_42_8]OGG36470.1 MAG: phosphoribosylaminoimidazolesuccinocarboxamide synthase [Candidatus Gottesmanbacteria bacterium RIFCSPLOWO2_02_FULL_42_29]OGG37356.1 MAG: phosphoribosylaminoimidazolesuccinocarboxamide synthase [Candidatus Gottesmanbacteria bacteri